MPASALTRPDPTHPFAPFRANDLPGCQKLFDRGFDPMWTDERGMSCAMEAAARGHGAALNLALRQAADPAALAMLKNDSGMDAFDMAAACGSTAAMSVLAKKLPAGHRSSIERGLAWHAVEASLGEPQLAYSWLIDLCLRPIDTPELTEAISRAVEINWKDGLDRLDGAKRRQGAQGYGKRI